MKYVLLFTILLCLTFSKIFSGYSEGLYYQLDQYGDIEIFKENGTRAEFASLTNQPAVIIDPNEIYTIKLKIINNGEKIKIFRGNIQIAMFYGSQEKNKVLLYEEKNIILKKLEIKEFIVKLEYNKVKQLYDKKEAFRIKVFYYTDDYVSQYPWLYHKWIMCSTLYQNKSNQKCRDTNIYFEEGYKILEKIMNDESIDNNSSRNKINKIVKT